MSIYSRVDVTSVKLCDNYILAGIGSYANVYRRKSAFLLKRIHCLRGQKIYGFILSECKRKIIIFGGKQFTVVSINKSGSEDGDDVSFEKLFEAVECNDWLHSSIWLDEDNTAVLTAHNVVQKWNIKNQTLTSIHPSSNNPILYSGLLLPLQHDILVLAGTVFSEVLIHCCGEDQAMHTLKGHRGVIFSISCKPEKGLIVTTSDDRSVRIWSVASDVKSHNDIKYWRNCNIVSTHEVYGHLARVMRSCIAEDMIISVGEDSALCFWKFGGKLLKKIAAHQNGCIWSVDADNLSVVTGGGDCGVTLHPMTRAKYNGLEDVKEISCPKKLVFTARHNVVVVSEDSVLTYYNLQLKTNESVKLHHESTYISISLSNCKQLIAIVDMSGNFDVFAERGKDTASIFRILNTKLNIGKILSLHFAGNRDIVFCSENGKITVLSANDSGTEIFAEFELPTCKERWLTAAAFDIKSKLTILGDRCGNIHFYKKGQKYPIQTLTKVHGRYGPTSITVKDDKIISTGRNGAIKHFSLDKYNRVQYLNTRDIEIQWVEKFLDKNENLVCGFKERDFIVLDVRNNSKIMEVTCGGGHRAWDAIRYIDKVNDEFVEVIKFMYLKNSELHILQFDCSKIVSKDIINGSHAKEINCLNSYKTDLNDAITFFISGGEDTTLRISSLNAELNFDDLYIFKQLSNIRTLKTMSINHNQILLVSAGGRAQICIKIIEFYQKNSETKVKTIEILDFLIKGTEKERKGSKKWTEQTVDFDPETRIMDVAVKRVDDEYFIFAGCSDAVLRVFKLTIVDKKTEFESVLELKAHKTCILKTIIIKYEERDFLATCTTRGEIALFDISGENIIRDMPATPVFALTTNKSGINSISWRRILNYVIIATGGDDNAVHLKLLQFSQDSSPLKVCKSWSTDKFHCSQITGLILLENNLVTTSIDQRVTLCRWELYEEDIKVDFIMQEYSDVSDIQGIDLIEETSEHVKICVFGKGMEMLQLYKNPNTD